MYQKYVLYIYHWPFLNIFILTPINIKNKYLSKKALLHVRGNPIPALNIIITTPIIVTKYNNLKQ